MIHIIHSMYAKRMSVHIHMYMIYDMILLHVCALHTYEKCRSVDDTKRGGLFNYDLKKVESYGT